MNIVGCFPVSASKVELAHEACGDDKTRVIGVTISVLVETEYVHELPEPWRKVAQDMLYKHAVEQS
jgi:hypothetical protein